MHRAPRTSSTSTEQRTPAGPNSGRPAGARTGSSARLAARPSTGGRDGPSYRITRNDDYTDNPDKRWKTQVRYDINNGAINVKGITLITDYWTDDVESGTHSASAVDGTGCGWYYNKIEGETWEQTCCNSDGTWANCCSSIISIDGGTVQVRITQT